MTPAKAQPAKPSVEIILSARRETWSVESESAAEGDVKLAKLRPQVLKRDQFTCCCCGFRSRKFQELHHLNGDHTDHRPDNLATICGFCHMGFHLGRAGLLGEAELIWLPEIPQHELSHLARAIFIAMHEGGEMQETAESLYSVLRLRADDARRRLGSSDPADLGEAMLALDDETYVRCKSSLEGIRLLPLGRRLRDDRDIFPDMLDFWRSETGPFAKIPTAKWAKLLDQALAA